MRPEKVKKYTIFFEETVRAYAEIFFLHGAGIGTILLLLTFFNPNVALSGLVAVVTVLAFAKFIDMNRDFIRSEFYIYNPLLVGMSIGFIFELTFISVILIILSTLFTFLLTMVLYTIFLKASVPILSLPFTFVSSLVYLASLSYTSLHPSTFYMPEFFLLFSSWSLWITAFFKALGTILFLPDVLIGIIFSLIFLWHSKLIFLAALLGFYSGIFFHGLLLGSFEQALLNPYSFNYILISIALATTFLIPSVRSVLLAVIAVAMSVLIIDATSIFWTVYKIPVFTLPFNIVTITLLFVLRNVHFKLFAYTIKSKPEQTLSSAMMSQLRFKSSDISIYLPFSGTWSVYQAFDDEWTHQGDWKYAYDFVIIGENGKSFKETGAYLNDYYAYKKPVLSPISGYVTEVMTHMEDNPIGEVDNVHNWGNFIILQTAGGVFVELSHFSEGSMTLRRGDYVEAGQFLGLCGNSGYSPQPHIHIQVQENVYLGSKTMPFHFVSFIHDKEIVYYDNPQKNDTITAYFNDLSLEHKMSFILNSKYTFEVYIDKKLNDTLELNVHMDPFSGKFFFKDQYNNKLYFAKDAGMFYFYDYQGVSNAILAKIYSAIPRFPLNAHKGFSWKDYIIAQYIYPTWINRFFSLGAIFSCKPYVVQGEWYFESENEIRGTLKGKKYLDTHIMLDETHGFKQIDIANISIRKKRSKIF